MIVITIIVAIRILLGQSRRVLCLIRLSTVVGCTKNLTFDVIILIRESASRTRDSSFCFSRASNPISPTNTMCDAT